MMLSPEERARKRDNVRRIIREMSSLPTLPTIVTEFEETLRRPQVDSGDIADLVGKDMATAARLLKVVNSAFYGGAYGEIADLRQAVTRLGIQECRRLVVSLALIRAFPNSSDHVDAEQFWKHAMAVAVASRELARASDAVAADPEELYAAGLLHDIGWLVLDQFLPNLAVNIVKKARAENIERRQAEMDVLGMDHGEVGGLVLDRWRLPIETVEAVSWHHDPDSAAPSARPRAAAIYAADILCRSANIGDSGETPPSEELDLALQGLGLPPAQADEVAAKAVEQAREKAEIIGAVLTGAGG